jgi:ribonuclease BN (tRNA processing enzyme)
MEGEAGGLTFGASAVEHVSSLDCFAFRASRGGRSLVYSGDSRLCAALTGLASDADVIVLECSCAGEPVHLSPADVAEVRRHARPEARIIVTHLDGNDHPDGFKGLIVAEDLARYSL